jgi:protein involved in polysaccharide export with SLBB domain
VNTTALSLRWRARVAVAFLAASLLPQVLAGQAAPAAPPITLRPGDLVSLRMWREQTLSGDFLVDERGLVTLPVIGVRNVVSAPWRAVHDSLLAAFSRELQAEGVQLIPKRRIFVLGFVQEPGAYFADPTVPIAGAIALAGGASNEGDLRRVRVLRDGVVLLDGVSLESPLAMTDVQSGDQIYVERRGWFDRNSPFFVSALVSFAGIIVTLIVAK